MNKNKRLILDWINIPIDTFYALKYSKKQALEVHNFIRVNFPEHRLNSFPIKLHVWILKMKIEL